MIIEASLIVIAVCMVILLIVAVLIGINLNKSIKSIDQAIATVEYKVDNALDEVSITLCQATTTLSSLNDLTISIKGKVDATDPLFHTIEKVGSVVDGFVSGSRPEFNLSNIINFSRTPKFSIKAADIAEWVGLGVLLWQNFKKRGKDE